MAACSSLVTGITHSKGVDYYTARSIFKPAINKFDSVPASRYMLRTPSCTCLFSPDQTTSTSVITTERTTVKISIPGTISGGSDVAGIPSTRICERVSGAMASTT